MSAFIEYNKDKSLLIENRPLPDFCRKCLSNPHKKCRNHYEKVIKDNVFGFISCPYGFYTYKSYDERIYTSLVIEENEMVKKLRKNLESTGEKISNFDKYTKSQFSNLVDIYEKLENDNTTFSYCVHDLKNMGNYFFGITETIKEDYSELYENDDNVKALCMLYDLINYRVDCIEGVRKQNNKRELKKIHPQMKKIAILMNFQAKNKNVKIRFNGTQENEVYMSRNIYLAIFLLLENAVKYSPFDSEIYINFIDHKDYSQVDISNHCRYIPQEEIPHLTEKGYRGSNASANGNGLGLALAKEILDENDAGFNITLININKEKSIFKVSFRFYTHKKK